MGRQSTSRAAARRARTGRAAGDARSRTPSIWSACSDGVVQRHDVRARDLHRFHQLSSLGASYPAKSAGGARLERQGDAWMPPAGIEPAHIGLKVRCSTAELRRPGASDCYRAVRLREGERRRSGDGGRRRRRTPEVAEAEIVAAAESLLRERSFRELTVDEVMRRTDLSRPSFYVYFRDRHHLMLRVVEHLGAELRTMSQRWYTGAGDGPAQAREAMEGIVEVYVAARRRCCARWPTPRPTTPRSSASTAASCTSFVDVTDPPHRGRDRGRARAPARRRRRPRGRSCG